MYWQGELSGARLAIDFHPSKYQMLLGGGTIVVKYGYTEVDGLGAEIVGILSSDNAFYMLRMPREMLGTPIFLKVSLSSPPLVMLSFYVVLVSLLCR